MEKLKQEYYTVWKQRNSDHVFCKMNNEPIEYINCGFLRDLTFMQIMVGYYKEDDTGREAAQRIVDSVKIDKTVDL